MPINPILLQEVKRAMASKMAFVAPGAPGDPAAAGAPPGGAPPMDPAMMAAAGGGGAPPMDPSMMGAPPGGAPPMDPAMMGAAGGAPPMDPSMMAAAGGAPPMDPAMMGGAPPAPAAPSPDAIRALIQEEIKKVNGGGSEGAPKKSKGAGKIDPGQMVEYMERQQKLLINLYESLGLSLPYNILDKAKGDEEGGQEAAPAKEQGTDASASGIPPIKPIEPMGGDKQASIAEKAQAARYLLNAMNRKGR